MIPSINIDEFRLVDKWLVAKASDIDAKHDFTKGFYMTGERQNFPVHYNLHDVVRDSDGNVAHYWFSAVDTPIKVVIYYM